MLVQSDSLEFLKLIQDYDNDIIYCDPPYALGSEVIIRKDGKVDYKKANDFMSKWEMPTGDYWEQWFIEAYRTLKHGGWLIMFGMDRQLLLFKYYAHLAGFEEQQSLYWYFISNFPKATDLSRMIEKNQGVQPIGKKELTGGITGGITGGKETGATDKGWNNIENWYEMPETQTELGKKYDGYKYSISPLKQTNETIMVFKKPTKTGSVLHDTLAYENGDTTITVGALNIDGNRVGIVGEDTRNAGNRTKTFGGEEAISGGEGSPEYIPNENGRYPAQTFIDSKAAEALDKQSGVSKDSVLKENQYTNQTGNNKSMFIGNKEFEHKEYGGGIGGCSKILHKCDYEQTDYDLYFYEPKVSSSERNAGCNGLSELETSTGLDTKGRTLEREDGSKTLVDRFVKQPQHNNHPTLKPIELNHRVLKLFKTPNYQKICYAFGGAGSEVIGGIKAGFDNWIGCEINQEYVDIANARIEYWKNEMHTQTDIFDFIER